MWFRVVLMVAAAASALITLYLASHRSANPTVFERWSGDYFVVLLAALTGTAVLAACQWRPIYQRLHRFRVPLVAVPASITCALLIVEGGIRILDALGVSYYELIRDYEFDKLDDAELSYRHRPNHENEYGGAQYSFNELGLRDDRLSPKGENEYRVVFLGDSVTLGIGALREDTFVTRLGPVLEARRKAPVRTINTGVGSYNTVQQWRFFRRHGDALDADLVVLVYIGNDINGMIRLNPKRNIGLAGLTPAEAFSRLLGLSWTYRLVNHVVRGKPADRDQAKRDSPGWQDSMAALAEIARECRKRNVPFVIAHFRRRRTARAKALWEDMGAIAQAESCDLIDIRPAFDGVDLNTTYVSRVDHHPNRKGHGLVVERIDSELARLGFPHR
ncbi:MAG: SGNH/GDSL hydrolase family protein [Planctomycetota bacterium]